MLRRYLAFWVLLASAIPLLGWWAYGLFDLDEGFYAAVTSEMNRRGEWITPFYNGQPWFEKPILLYWFAKPSIAVFGEDFGPRLPSVLATLACYAMVLWFGRRHFGTRGGVFATLVLASSPLVVAVGRMMMTDPLLLLCITGAFLTFWESLASDPRWRIASALFLGLGVLTKGPVVGILFLIPLVWMATRHPNLRPKFTGNWLPGVLVFFLVVSTWYVPAYVVNDQTFIQEFLVKQNLQRFSGGDQAHTVTGIPGLLFYPVVGFICFLPWSVLLPASWTRAPESPLNSYLKAWFLTVFFFFTLTSAKLPHYILPLSVPFSLLVGQHLALRSSTRPRTLAAPIAALAILTVLVNVGFQGYYRGIKIGPLDFPGFHEEVHQIARYVRSHAMPGDVVAEYKIGRQQKDLGTGHIKIQETKQPSVLLYLNRNTLETDDWGAILAQRRRTWIITRWNRITPEEESAAFGRLKRVEIPTRNDLFRLYLLEPLVLFHTAPPHG